jgi:hypothetical protein
MRVKRTGWFQATTVYPDPVFLFCRNFLPLISRFTYHFGLALIEKQFAKLTEKNKVHSTALICFFQCGLSHFEDVA